MDTLVAVTGAASPQPRVLALTPIFRQTVGSGGRDPQKAASLLAAGGINAAEEAGIDGNQTTSLEGVIAMNPEVIMSLPSPSNLGLRSSGRACWTMRLSPSCRQSRTTKSTIVESKHFTTLSYWNIRGAEDLARMLWPDQFPEPAAASFSLAE